MAFRSELQVDATSLFKQQNPHDSHPGLIPNVTIYPNSTILGGKTFIGANSTIGANVFLMHSVLANSLVVYEEKQLAIRDNTAKKKTADFDWTI